MISKRHNIKDKLGNKPLGKNFILTMLRLHSGKEIIRVVSDQIGCPTSAKELAKVCCRIIS